MVFSNDFVSVFVSLNPEVETQKDFFFDGKNSFESCRLTYTDRQNTPVRIYLFLLRAV